MRILVTGSRTWTDPEPIRRALMDLATAAPPDEPIIVVHGAAAGADAIASQWARAMAGRVREERHPADWALHGRAAGMIRNLEMVRSGVDLCLAFIRDDSAGATHCARTAESAGIETRITRWIHPTVRGAA